jgi:hypothetical protein
MMRYHNKAVQVVCWLLVLAVAVSACAGLGHSIEINRLKR